MTYKKNRWPDWVLKHKQKGIAIENRDGKFYASRIHSVWSPEKKRAKKITDEYLGVITPDGILPPKHKRPPTVGGILEAGNILYLYRFAQSLEAPLKEFFPDSWQSILAAGVLKLAYLEPLKRLSLRYQSSQTSVLWPEAHLSKNSLTDLIEKLGLNWQAQRRFFEKLAESESHLAIDLTQIFSKSENIAWLEKGYNHKEIWHDQLQILLLWGVDTHTPGFLKLLPGTASSAQNLVRTIQELELSEVVVFGDKAFYSAPNVNGLEANRIHYALPVPRDTPFLKYGAATKYKEYFAFRDGVQWWREYESDGRRIVQFLDKRLAADEEVAFLKRIDEGKGTRADLNRQRNRFGTLAIITDLGLPPKSIYETYKQRREIESAFDSLKNTLEGDKTWMQSRESLQGYFFILFIALHLYSQVLEHLRRKKLLEQYSVEDVLTILSKVYLTQVNERRILAEVTRTTRELIKELEVPITENLGS